MGLRRLDAFVKTRPDLQQKSAAGGIITLVAAAAAALLFVGQTYVYIMGRPHHSLGLSKSFSTPLHRIPRENDPPIPDAILHSRGKIPMRLHITFPYLNCDQLDVTHDGASLRSGDLDKIHGKHSLQLRKPTSSELSKLKGNTFKSSGCTVEGTLRPQIVAGILQISFSHHAWSEATALITTRRLRDKEMVPEMLKNYNISHYIHKVEFGQTFPYSTHKPLENRAHVIENDYGGIAVEQIQVKLVPTISHGIFFKEKTYQTSVVDTTIQPQTLVAHGVPYLPGLVISYDFTPLQIDHTQGRDNILVFVSSLLSIVAGAFVTVGLVTGCLVNTASEIAKKID